MEGAVCCAAPCDSVARSMDTRTLQRVNLIEVLTEAAEAAGLPVPDLPEDAAACWTEQQIKAAFVAPSSSPEHPKFPEPDVETFNRWFPGLSRSATATAQPRLRIVCLPCAGSAEDMYTSEGTGTRRAPSPLLEWCRDHKAELLAVQPPGRGLRLQDPPAATAQQLASQILQVLGSRLCQQSVPWVVISHSVGSWVAYEMLRACRTAGVPLPCAWFLSAMPAPDLPEDQRPWRRQALLDEPHFKEECRGWDINEMVFSNGMWAMYQPLLRADFTLFDSYKFEGHAEAPFPDLRIIAWWGEADRRVKEHMVQGWQRFTTGSFTCSQHEGNHLWPLDKACKQIWLTRIVTHLDQLG